MFLESVAVAQVLAIQNGRSSPGAFLSPILGTGLR